MNLVSRTEQWKPVPEVEQMNRSQAKLVCLKAWVFLLCLETGGYLGLLLREEGSGLCVSVRVHVCACAHMFFAGAGGSLSEELDTGCFCGN